jgi:proteasome accessory factor C
MSETGSERLRRLLLVVPAARARPGIPLDDLAHDLGCTREELESDLELLGQVGVPPFSPDDLVEIERIDDRVFVRLPQTFGRPLRLTAPEAAAVTAAVHALAPGDRVLASAVGKLGQAVSRPQRPLYDALVARLVSTPEPRQDAVAATCAEAARQRRALDIDYFARTESVPRTRRVKPRAVVSLDGARYLGAVNEKGEERTYRLDRIAAARLTDERFDPLPAVDLESRVRHLVRLPKSPDLPRATVHFSPKVAAAARARHPDAKAASDGSVVAEVAFATEAWLVSYVLSWGGQARITAPETAREALRQAAARALARHRD